MVVGTLGYFLDIRLEPEFRRRWRGDRDRFSIPTHFLPDNRTIPITGGGIGRVAWRADRRYVKRRDRRVLGSEGGIFNQAITIYVLLLFRSDRRVQRGEARWSGERN